MSLMDVSSNVRAYSRSWGCLTSLRIVLRLELGYPKHTLLGIRILEIPGDVYWPVTGKCVTLILVDCTCAYLYPLSVLYLVESRDGSNLMDVARNTEGPSPSTSVSVSRLPFRAQRHSKSGARVLMRIWAVALPEAKCQGSFLLL